MTDLQAIYGIGDKRARHLESLGLESIVAVADADLATLQTLRGVGDSRAKKIKYSARRLAIESDDIDREHIEAVACDRSRDGFDSDAADPGIRYELSVEVDGQTLQELIEESKSPPYLASRSLLGTPDHYSVTQTDDHTLVEAEGERGRFGISYQAGSDCRYYIDRENEGYAPITDQQLSSGSPTSTPEITVDQTADEQVIDGRRARKVVATLHPSLSRLQFVQEVWICDDEDLAPFADIVGERVLAHVVSHDPGLVTEITAGGVPMKGTMTGPDENQISAFALKEIKLAEIPRSVFEPPAGYTNLKEQWLDVVETGERRQSGSPSRSIDVHPHDTIWRPGDTGVGAGTRHGVRTGTGGLGETGTTEPGDAGSGITGPDEDGTVTTTHKQARSVASCLPSTDRVDVAANVRQPTLDTARELANMIARRLGGFEGSDGSIAIDWMRQFREHAKNNDNDGLFCLFHESMSLDSNGVLDDLGGCGLLDGAAEREARRVLASFPPNLLPQSQYVSMLGNTFDIPYPMAMEMVLVIQDLTVEPDDRYDELPLWMQGTLRDTIMFFDETSTDLDVDSPGSFAADYPENTEWSTLSYDLSVIGEVDFLDVRLADIGFAIDIDAASSQPDLLQTLSFTDGGGVELELSVPELRFESTVDSRVPIGVDFSTDIEFDPCTYLPWISCEVGLALSLLAEWFITLPEFAFDTTIDAVEFDATVVVVEDADGYCRPVVETTSLEVNSVAVTYEVPSLSELPDLPGIEYLLPDEMTLSEFANGVVNDIADELVDEAELLVEDVNDLLPAVLTDAIDTPKLTFPIEAIENGFGVVSSDVFGRAETVDDIDLYDLYVESSLGATGEPRYTGINTAVDADLRTVQYEDASNFHDDVVTGGDRHYLSAALSQNYLNYHLASLRDDGAFDFRFDSQYREVVTERLFELIDSNPPGEPVTLVGGGMTDPDSSLAFVSGESLNSMSLTAAAPPRVQLLPTVDEHGVAAITTFDDLRLCFEWIAVNADGQSGRSKKTVELSVSVALRTVPGFRLAGGGGDHAPTFDLFFEIEQPGVDVTALEVHDLQTIVTGSGGPATDHPKQLNLAGLEDDAKARWHDLVVALVSTALNGKAAAPAIDRNAATIPVESDEPTGVQSYLSNALSLVVQFRTQRNILYAHVGLDGTVIDLFEQDVFDTLTCNQAQGFYEDFPEDGLF